MKNWQEKFLTLAEQNKIETSILNFEKKTGTELVIAILRTGDPYPAASLRFAILFTLILSGFLLLFFHFKISYFLLAQIILLILGILLGKISYFKSLCLDQNEVDRELKEKSKELFSDLKMTKTSEHNGILLTLGLEEKRFSLLVDQTIKQKISAQELEQWINLLQSHFKKKLFAQGLQSIIDQLQQKLLHLFPSKVSSSQVNELSNKIIWLD